MWRIVQYAGQYVVVKPRVFHCVFNVGDNVAEAINFACSNHATELVHVPNKYRYLHCSSGWRKENKAVGACAIGHQRGVAELYARDALTLQHYGQGSSSSLNRRLLFDARKSKTLQF